MTRPQHKASQARLFGSSHSDDLEPLSNNDDESDEVHGTGMLAKLFLFTRLMKIDEEQQSGASEAHRIIAKDQEK